MTVTLIQLGFLDLVRDVVVKLVHRGRSDAVGAITCALMRMNEVSTVTQINNALMSAGKGSELAKVAGMAGSHAPALSGLCVLCRRCKGPGLSRQPCPHANMPIWGMCLLVLLALTEMWHQAAVYTWLRQRHSRKVRLVHARFHAYSLPHMQTKPRCR